MYFIGESAGPRVFLYVTASAEKILQISGELNRIILKSNVTPLETGHYENIYDDICTLEVYPSMPVKARDVTTLYVT